MSVRWCSECRHRVTSTASASTNHSLSAVWVQPSTPPGLDCQPGSSLTTITHWGAQGRGRPSSSWPAWPAPGWGGTVLGLRRSSAVGSAGSVRDEQLSRTESPADTSLPSTQGRLNRSAACCSTLTALLSQQHHHCHYSHNSNNNTNTATTLTTLTTTPTTLQPRQIC